MQDYSNYKGKKKNWGHIYHLYQEEIPEDIPKPQGKATPIDWFSKRQNNVETATYGSEFAAARTAVDQI
eukprot:8813635-Ditylum_brightwellii.AAC.1